MLRPRVSWVLVLLACSPAPVMPEPPVPPVLEGDGAIVHSQSWTLRGSAPVDTLVRLHLDEACRGPSLRDVTPAELEEGVVLELVSGTPNVFSAVSIDERGLMSSCSAPVRVTFDRPRLPRFVNVTIDPMPPTRETHFTIHGTVEDAVSVLLFEGTSCAGAPLAELSPDAFRQVGFPIDVEPNGDRHFMLAALNVIGESSGCSTGVLAWNDQLPPDVRPALRSPAPSPEEFAFISVSANAEFGTAFLGPDCTGPALKSCTGSDCRLLVVEFPMAASSTWSAHAVDALGNMSRCVEAPEAWGWDPLAPPPVIELTLGPDPRLLFGKVPVSSSQVELFSGPLCDPDQLIATTTAAQLVGGGLFTPQLGVPSDGGVLTARGLRSDLTTTGCSQPVPWH